MFATSRRQTSARVTVRATLVALVAGAVCFWASPSARAADLSKDEESLLQVMDSQTAQAALELVGKVKAWRDRFEALKKEAAKLGDDADAAGKSPGQAETVKLVLDVAEALKPLAAKSPEVARYLKYHEKVEATLTKAEQRWKGARYDPELYSDLDEAHYREEVKRVALAAAAHELLQFYDGELFTLVEGLKNPAQVARRVLEDLLKKKAFDQPYNFGDVSLRIKADPNKLQQSLFAPDPGLTIEVVYLGKLKAEATGLYFRPNGTPVFDRVKFKTRPEDLAKQAAGLALTSLGDAIPDIGLPVTLKEPRFNGFDGKDGKKPGSVSFLVVIGLGGYLDVKPADAIRAEGRVTLSGDGATLDRDLSFTWGEPIPLPGTPLILDGFTVTFNPKDREKTVSIKTFLAPATGGKQGVSLDITMRFGLPFNAAKGVTFDGTLVLARSEHVGKVGGRISGKEVSGFLNIPPPDGSVLPIGDMLNADFQFRIDKDAFSAHGLLSLFRMSGKSFGLLLEFNGHGSLTTRDELTLFGCEVSSTLEASFTPGFKELKLDATFQVNLDGGLGFRSINAVVSVSAVSPARGRRGVIVKADALGLDPVVLELDDMSDLARPDKLLAEFKRQLLEHGLDAFLAALGELGEQSDQLLANAERDCREKVSGWAKKAHLDKVSTGNPEVDKRLGELSDSGKNLMAFGGKSREKAGKFLKEFANTPLDTLGGAADSTLNDAKDFLSKPFGGFDLDGSAARKARDERNRREAEARRIQEARDRENRARERLKPLLTAINRYRFDEEPRKQAGVRPKGPLTALHMDCDNAASAVEGEKDVVIGWVVLTNGFTLNPGRPAVRGSGARGAYVRITGLLGKDGRPRAKIVIPELKHGSTLPARTILRDAIAELIEKYLPEVEIEGRFKERLLAVRNATDEPVTVWALADTQVYRDDGPRWEWRPADPKDPARASSFTLKPGETLTLRTRDAIEFKGLATTGDQPVRGRVARVWAESASGFTWTHRLKEDLVLVSEKDTRGHACYYADQMETHTYTLERPQGQRTWRQRTVQVRNETDAPLVVNASALAPTPLGGQAWHAAAANTKVEPGKTVALVRADNGWPLRGEELHLWAEDEKGERYRWTKYHNDPLAQTDGDGYRAERPGVMLYVLRDPSDAGDDLREEPPSDLDARQPVRRLLPDQVKVPAVKEMPLKQAVVEVRRAGLKPKAEDGARLDDQVVAQNPGPGWQKLTGAVALTVESRVRVPDVRGEGPADARKQVEADGLEFRALIAGDPVPKNAVERLASCRVKTQDPPPGALVKKGSAVVCDFEVVGVKVPDVVGKTPPEAKKLLDAAGLNMRAVNLSEGARVREQKPAAGATARPGDTVVVTFPPKAPDPDVTVPDVTGKALAEAKKAIEDAGLLMKSKNYTEGAKVKDQDPRAGARVKRDTIVEVVFADRPPPPVVVPGVIGKTYAEARKAVEEAGLVLQSEGSAEGATVQKQSPLPRREAKRGDTVTVTFAVKPPPEVASVEVPDVRGLGLEQAAARLEERGLGYRTLNDANGQTVRDQQPAAGLRVRKGTNVVLQFPDKPPERTVPLPDLRGTVGVRAVQAALSESGLKIAVFVRARGRDFPVPNPNDWENLKSHKLVEELPGAGTKVPVGSTVQCLFEQQEEGPKTVRVPEVSGKTSAEAEQALAGAGLKMKSTVAEGPSGLPPGRAFKQSPLPGTPVQPGETVQVFFTKESPARR